MYKYTWWRREVHLLLHSKSFFKTFSPRWWLEQTLCKFKADAIAHDEIIRNLKPFSVAGFKTVDTV